MAHVRLAGALLAAHDTTAALAELATANMINPSDPFVSVYLGALLGEAGRLAEAKRQLEMTIQTDSDYATPHLYLARVLDRQGDSLSARAEYAAYLAHASRNADELPWVRKRIAARP
jgi:predicted Zn-dependent protease